MLTLKQDYSLNNLGKDYSYKIVLFKSMNDYLYTYLFI